MTAGYGSGGHGPEDGRPTGAGPGGADAPSDRPGPLPPRVAPPQAAGTRWSAAPTAGQSFDPGPAAAAPRATWPSAAPHTGQWGGPTHGGAATGQTGAAPTYGAVLAPAAPGTGAPTAPGAGGGYPPAAPAPAPGFPGAGPYPPAGPPSFPVPGQPSHPAPAGYPSGPAAGYPAAGAQQVGGSPRRRRWPALLTALVALVLAVVAGVQAYQLDRLGDRLAATDRRLAQAQDADGTRLDGVEKRAEALEKQAGAAFNPEAVASAVLPSVFRVRAGDFTGTAFAVGKPVAGGGTNLFTNFHVVESVWNGGGRQVFLERTDQRFPATIVKVDKTNDVAQLRTNGKFSGLAAASTPVKSGQQIVVVGAPLGLEDSVTTGVVSALRAAQGDSGPAIQFDAPINPGNSGGPVINGSKQVVGIATAKARDAEGIGLAVPIKVACDGFKIC
ncbi:trypsin-like peptidase domain-containing protein [Micromonospora sp. GCM10011542]|uniref:trypsin-like peptidase domain-containing protein n=1 Tax=Micromonospora sp. GCM10011542 TaxID=3317337 RepID=UPI00361049F4